MQVAVWSAVSVAFFVLYLFASIYGLTWAKDKANKRGVHFYEHRPMLSGKFLQVFGDGLLIISAVVFWPIACFVISRMKPSAQH